MILSNSGHKPQAKSMGQTSCVLHAWAVEAVSLVVAYCIESAELSPLSSEGVFAAFRPKRKKLSKQVQGSPDNMTPDNMTIALYTV